MDIEIIEISPIKLSGTPIRFQSILQGFYQKWLPKSGFELDKRPHFETFDETYDPFSESSVERIWIPNIQEVKPKKANRLNIGKELTI